MTASFNDQSSSSLNEGEVFDDGYLYIEYENFYCFRSWRSKVGVRLNIRIYGTEHGVKERLSIVEPSVSTSPHCAANYPHTASKLYPGPTLVIAW